MTLRELQRAVMKADAALTAAVAAGASAAVQKRLFTRLNRLAVALSKHWPYLQRKAARQRAKLAPAARLKDSPAMASAPREPTHQAAARQAQIRQIHAAGGHLLTRGEEAVFIAQPTPWLGPPVPTAATTTVMQLVQRARALGTYVPEHIAELALDDETLRLAGRSRAPGAGRPTKLTQYDRHAERIDEIRRAIATAQHRAGLSNLGSDGKKRAAANDAAAIDAIARGLLSTGTRAGDLRRAVLDHAECRWSESTVRRHLITLGLWKVTR